MAPELSELLVVGFLIGFTAYALVRLTSLRGE
jgi:hypothetical protein